VTSWGVRLPRRQFGAAPILSIDPEYLTVLEQQMEDLMLSVRFVVVSAILTFAAACGSCVLPAHVPSRRRPRPGLLRLSRSRVPPHW
jgi:hypothetical protein